MIMVHSNPACRAGQNKIHSITLYSNLKRSESRMPPEGEVGLC